MQDDFDTERRATLIKEARAITAALKSEIVDLGTQLGRVLDGRQWDGDDDGDFDASEAREERLAATKAFLAVLALIDLCMKEGSAQRFTPSPVIS